jgi:hypothetical protein
LSVRGECAGLQAVGQHAGLGEPVAHRGQIVPVPERCLVHEYVGRRGDGKEDVVDCSP